MIRKSIIIVCILLTYRVADAQAPGECKSLIFRLNTEIGIEKFKSDLPSYFSGFRCLDQDFELYSVRIPADRDANIALAALNCRRGCLVSQISHNVTRRYTPNDPLVSSQIYLDVIRAYTAWDHARGKGVTGFGDTIVIAQIDDGLDTLQPDLAENVWRNRSEIPWNGIDDDSNGYMDDYWGWNGGDSNCRVVTSQTIGQGHGTEVAGVMGAVTDNNMGISGIAYKTKILPLLCYSTNGTGDGEIGVIRCMLYALRQKRLYISSKGTKGANIVVANFSIGIDRTFAADAPLWCAFYDSLGVAGILSAGATSDANNDVDAVGDIPSTCPSKYLIAVSYTDNADVRQSSGYSPTQIDLAAPGQDIYTTRQRRDAGSNPPYANQSGTSFSTPMVTGAVAFIYNNVCDSFLKFQRKHNDSAQGLLKSWILNGTDAVASLSGKCLTGGRLNLYKVWQNMNSWCSAHDFRYAVSTADIQDLRIYPNPLLPGNEIFLSGFPSGTYQCVITDLSGKYQAQGKTQMVQDRLIFRPGILKPGMYIFTCTAGQKQLVRKLQVL